MEQKSAMNQYFEKKGIKRDAKNASEIVWMYFLASKSEMTDEELDLFLLKDLKIVERDCIRIALLMEIEPEKAVTIKSYSDIKNILSAKSSPSEDLSEVENRLLSIENKLDYIKDMEDGTYQKLDMTASEFEEKYIPEFIKTLKKEISAIQNVILNEFNTSAQKNKKKTGAGLTGLVLKIKNLRNKSKSNTDIFEILEKGNFSKDQADVIIGGLKEGLNQSDVILYAKKEYSAEKMENLKNFLLLKTEGEGKNKTYQETLPTDTESKEDAQTSKQKDTKEDESDEGYYFSAETEDNAFEAEEDSEVFEYEENKEDEE